MKALLGLAIAGTAAIFVGMKLLGNKGAGASGAQLSVVPSQFQHTAQFTINGAGFAPNAVVTLNVGDVTKLGALSFSVVADSNGVFSKLVPANSPLTQLGQLSVTAIVNSQQLAQATITVT